MLLKFKYFYGGMVHCMYVRCHSFVQGVTFMEDGDHVILSVSCVERAPKRDIISLI